jgi:hypothetical protein
MRTNYKAPSTNNKNHPVYNYIISAIYPDECELEKQPETDKEKLQFVLNTFKSEYNHMIKRVGEYKAFQEWLSGLPSVFNIDFENYKILKLAKKWKSIPKNATEKQEDKIIENWFNFITMKFFALCRRNKVI